MRAICCAIIVLAGAVLVAGGSIAFSLRPDNLFAILAAVGFVLALVFLVGMNVNWPRK